MAKQVRGRLTQGRVVALVEPRYRAWSDFVGQVGVVPQWAKVGTWNRGVVKFSHDGATTVVVGKLRPATPTEEAVWRLGGDGG